MRLVKELRLLDISTMDGAKDYAPGANQEVYVAYWRTAPVASSLAIAALTGMPVSIST